MNIHPVGSSWYFTATFLTVCWSPFNESFTHNRVHCLAKIFGANMVLRFNTFPSSLTYNLSSPPSLLVSCPSKGILFSWQMSNCSVPWLFLLWQLRHNCLSALGFTCLLSSWLQHSWKTLCISAAFGSEPPLRTLTFCCRLAAMNSCVFSLLRLLLSSLSFVP